jgi:hypothetical protein
MTCSLGVIVAVVVPLADATDTDTDIAILSLASMIGGYLLLAGLWYFVFREKREEKQDRRPD